jgi:TRAP-type C4-dicarboxylate transport system permease large subunit
MIFSAMSGVAQADAAGLGLIEIKAMRERGFDPAFSAVVSAASAIIGPILPPSVIMVIYGLLAQVSVGDLFLAGILSGVLMGFSLMGMIYFLAVTGRIKAPVEPRASFKEVKESFLTGLPIVMSVNLIIGAITPPFGVILFILKDIAGVTFGAIVRAVLPFYIPLGLTLLLITYWPDFVLFVPRLFKG